jgi:hypothetical protein
MKYKGRGVFSRESLMHFMRKHEIRSISQLEKIIKKRDPRVHDYRREFGSWQKALYEVWGKPVTTDFTPIYMLQCICLCRSYTARAYEAVRRKNPHTYPSLRSIMLEWGSWKQAREQAKALAFEPAENARRELAKKLGHSPTVKECKKHGINVEPLLRHYENEEDFEDITRRVDRIRAKQKRSSAKVSGS